MPIANIEDLVTTFREIKDFYNISEELSKFGYKDNNYNLYALDSFSPSIARGILLRENKPSIDVFVAYNYFSKEKEGEHAFINLESKKEFKHFLRNVKLHKIFNDENVFYEHDNLTVASIMGGTGVGAGSTVAFANLGGGAGFWSFMGPFIGGFAVGAVLCLYLGNKINNKRVKIIEENYKNYEKRMVFGAEAIELAKQYV